MKRSNLTVALAVVATLALSATWSDAAQSYLYSGWSNVTSINDVNENGLPQQLNIQKIYYARDDQYHYFRMDLEKVPQVGNTDIYSFYFDAAPGGANGPTNASPYIPSGLTGIDHVIGATTQGGSFFKEYQSGTWTSLNSGEYKQSGLTLEWKTSLGDLPLNFSSWGVSVRTNNLWGNYDIAGPLTATPIPASAWLFASGIIGLVGLKRKSRKLS